MKKIGLEFMSLYGKDFILSEHVKVGDELIILDGCAYYQVTIVHIFSGVVFYKRIKKKSSVSTMWEDETNNTIFHIVDGSPFSTWCYPTEINIYDWVKPAQLNKVKVLLDDLDGGIKINYKGKYAYDGAWLARDKSGYLYIYEGMPQKGETRWSAIGDRSCFQVAPNFDKAFLNTHIGWEDAPIEVEIKLREN